jgi:ABC-type branched-subunit amino acid transport system ATPase component/ABC-type branched-subunit amino acid transport system permease subunit
MATRSSGPAAGLSLAIVAITAAACVFSWQVGGYFAFVAALVGLITVAGVGLNVLVGLTGQISLGHVGFYAIGAYGVAILTLAGVDYWVAFLVAGALAGAVGGLLALPALRVSGPYLAMVTIAFGFIVEHGAIEARGLTGGQNGLMGFSGPHLGGVVFSETQIAIFAILLAGLSMLLFQRLLYSGWGRAMLAVRDSEVAARSTGLSPTVVKTVAFAISAALTGLAGAVLAPLMMFIAPSSFHFSQSILFLFAVLVGGAGWTLGPLVGALVTVLLPEILADLAEYRLLFFGATLILVLWLAPSGLVGAVSRLVDRRQAAPVDPVAGDIAGFIDRGRDGLSLVVDRIGISFGGIHAAQDVSFRAEPGRITSIIGPNGAGKTTVLNMIGAFYRPGTGSIRLGELEIAGRSPSWVSRAGVARTYQTTKLFESLSVLDNVLIAMRRGSLGNPLGALARGGDAAGASALLHFVGYRGSVDRIAGDLPHVDRRLVEIARALALRPRVLLLDEPAAGLSEAEKQKLAALMRTIADHGITMVLVEHDMAMVMGISDHVVVLDAGRPIAEGAPEQVRDDPAVIDAYLGSGELKTRARAAPLDGSAGGPVLSVEGLTAGYGAAPVLKDVDLRISRGEMVGVLGANGAGKSTTMRAIVGLLRPVKGRVALETAEIQHRAAYEIARQGVALVPEGRQVFPELTVLDNIRIGAHRRGSGDYSAEIGRLLDRFPRLKERLHVQAGLISGGEQQMLAIARGLMAKPRVLLLDEPSLGLAPAIIEELFDVLADLRDEGTTVLIVDQMASMTLGVADRAYVLQQGTVVRSGAAAEIAGDAALEAAYLGGGAETVEDAERAEAP